MSTRKALAFSYLDRYASLIIGFATSMIIARLLTPTELGVFSIAMVLIGFLGPFRDMGVGQYIIQEKDLTIDRIRAAWTIQLFLGVSIALIIFLMRNVVAEFYHEPRLGEIMLVLAGNSLIMPFGSLTNARLSRELRFDVIAIIRFSATIGGCSTSIGCAWLGFGAISLAYGSFVHNLIYALVSMAFRLQGVSWLPGFNGLRYVLKFGGGITGIGLLNTLYQGFPELLIGRCLSIVDAGFFSRSQGLVNMFDRLVLDGAYSVALPIFSKQLRERGDLGDTFVKAVEMLTGIGWVFLGFLALMAHPIIFLLFGSQWESSVNLTRWLGLAMCCLLPAVLCGSPMIAKGHIYRVFWLGVVNVVLQASVLWAVISFGLEFVGYGLMVSSSLIAVVWLVMSRSIIGFTWWRLFLALGKSALVAIIASMGPGVVVWFYGWSPNNYWEPLIVACFGLLAGFLISIKAVSHPLWFELGRLFPKRYSRVFNSN